MHNDSWDRRIRRAETLATEIEEVRQLLTFYSYILREQHQIYEGLKSTQGWSPTGNLESDLSIVRSLARDLINSVANHGTEMLIADALRLRNDDSELDKTLMKYWREPEDTNFFAKAIIQPYASLLREAGIVVDRDLPGGINRCPMCAGKPQLSIIRSGQSTDGGSRELTCATCLNSWGFRRVVCANCGEQDPSRVGYYQTSRFQHLRVEACDNCKYYIKGIDLTVNGLAIPIVDEVAGASLDIWARERGYEKIELNLVGT